MDQQNLEHKTYFTLYFIFICMIINNINFIKIICPTDPRSWICHWQRWWWSIDGHGGGGGRHGGGEWWL